MSKATSFTFAVFEKLDGPLSKSIELDNQGKPRSNSGDCRMSAGVAQNVTVSGPSELAVLIGQFTSKNALALGTIVGLDCGDPVGITTKKHEAESNGAIARTKGNFTFTEGAPGFLLLDVDLKGISIAVKAISDGPGTASFHPDHFCRCRIRTHMFTLNWFSCSESLGHTMLIN